MENAVVTVNEVNLPIKEWGVDRVVTFKDIDKAHERPDGTASRNFVNNRQYFIEGIDFFIIKKSDFQNNEIRCLGVGEENVPNRGLTLITESGYLMIAKSFTDKKSWHVQRQLVNSYFKLKEVSYNMSEKLPVDLSSINKTIQELSYNFQTMCKQINSMENAFDGQFIEFKQAIERISLLLPDAKAEESKQSISLIVSTDPIRDTIRPLAELYNDKSIGYNNTYRKVYAAMPVDWKYRQSLYRNRKGNKNKPSKLVLLESDRKLLVMFSDAVKQLMSEATGA